MQLSNINSSFDKCCKPRRFNAFKGSEDTESRVRYKRYSEMSDEMLSIRSIAKAHNDVERSGKMRLFKALPYISAGLLGTTIAITQPGKLSAKAASGLGFLALLKGTSLFTGFVSDKYEKAQAKKGVDTTSDEHIVKRLGVSIGAIVGGAVAIALGAKVAPKVTQRYFKGFDNFIRKDAAKLADEINATKLGGFVEKTINPFTQKHDKLTKAVSALSPFAIATASVATGGALINSMSNDIKQKAQQNFLKGKFIQQVARQEFDKIDAIEVK